MSGCSLIAPSDRVGTIASVGRPRSIRIQVPRWVQLVSLPLALLLLWSVAGAVRHVLFLFLVALLIALLLNPIVRGLGKAWIPRGAAIALVYLAFAAAVALVIARARDDRRPADQDGDPSGRRTTSPSSPDTRRTPGPSRISPASRRGSTGTT